MENPLTSAALQYFYYSKDREPDKKILRPEKSLKIVETLIQGKNLQEKYGIIIHSCEYVRQQDVLGRIILSLLKFCVQLQKDLIF
jgi:hypothetical protein